MPPRRQTGEGEGLERHATWLELFVDLVFVVAVAGAETTPGVLLAVVTSLVVAVVEGTTTPGVAAPGRAD